MENSTDLLCIILGVKENDICSHYVIGLYREQILCTLINIPINLQWHQRGKNAKMKLPETHKYSNFSRTQVDPNRRKVYCVMVYSVYKEKITKFKVRRNEILLVAF